MKIFIIALLLAIGYAQTERRTLTSQEQDWFLVGSTIDGDSYNGQAGCISISGDGLTIATSAANHNERRGRVRMFQWDEQNEDWVQKGDSLSGGTPGDEFGHEVSTNFDGSIVAVGTTKHAQNGAFSGLVQVYSWTEGSWQQMGQNLYGQNREDYFGRRVSLSDDGMTLAISAFYSDHSGWYEAGHVEIWTWNNGAWEQKGSDVLGDPTNHYDIFGAALAMSGDGNNFIVSAPNKQSKAGSVRVYNWKDGSWQKLGNDMMGEASNDENGRSVDINYDGTAIIMGARGSGEHGPFTGQARMYRWDGSSWVQMGDTLVGLGEENQFGNEVAISADGRTIGISAQHNDADGNRRGYVSVFVWNEDEQTWKEVGNRIIGDQDGARIGAYVDFDSDASKVAIGSYNYVTDAGRSAGRVAVYSHEHLKPSEPDCQEPTTPYGGTQSITRYSIDFVNAPETCESETRTRTCNAGGVWGEYSGSFTYETCYAYSMCGNTQHGDRINRIRYLDAEVNFPSACVPETQYAVCNDGEFGAWSGSGFEYDSCVVRAMCSDIPNGAYEFRTMFEEETVDYPLTCQSEEQSRLCNDGEFESWDGTFTHTNCEVEACTFVCTDEYQEMVDEKREMATRLAHLESVVSTIIDNMRNAAVDLEGQNLSRRNLADNRLMKELESFGLLKA